MSDQAPTLAVRLQSKDHEEILNVIDQLRAEGISKYVNLPQLIVCGDQSSGKSSVLEAISGLDFPRKDNVCTRFATELILRRSPDTGVTISIFPDEDRSPSEQSRLNAFESPTTSLDRFGEIVQSAADLIGVGSGGLLFSRDVLRVEVTGPSQPHLTLVDLPGLYHASDEQQNEEGVAFVESLVLSYMENKRSVMLAVISANSDIALQKVTTFTRRVDPDGERTLGIITKPDRLEQGSELEKSFLDLARNKRMPFRLGWHVLKNRKYEERAYTIAQRNEAEMRFLSEGVWWTLPRPQVGITSLRPRLSTILKDHILSQMSGLLSETQAACSDAEAGLSRLGQSRQTLSEQRQYLLRASEKFTWLMTAAVNGTYLDPFFGDALLDDDYEKRLRAVVQNRLSDFSDTVGTQGEQRRIMPEGGTVVDEKKEVSRSDLLNEVKRRMRRSRGRELPGTFDPLIIGELFFAHAKPWTEIVRVSIDTLLEDVRRATTWILHEVLDDRSIEGLFDQTIDPYLSILDKTLRRKADELLKPHQLGHPITYNHYFTDTVQAIRAERARKSITRKLEDFFGDYYPSSVQDYSKMNFRMSSLIATLSSAEEKDMESFACSEVVDCMLAYYKVARKRFVDDISSLAIEECLLTPLLTMFCPHKVDALSDATIEAIAQEDESTRAERIRLTAKVGSLKKSVDALRRLDVHKMTTRRESPQINGSVDEHPLKTDGKPGIGAKHESVALEQPIEVVEARPATIEVYEQPVSSADETSLIWPQSPNQDHRSAKRHMKRGKNRTMIAAEAAAVDE